ncbi:hypothetical protein MLD38_001113 [Melastoma candidum]|uniref:Uncharacterized protein n=1 Tax=Melastoma candidum TaxID=119954 RepID=A0ACB9SDI5_9MYRT|nr:hypothetical protein MLD38_001113 [Melastoma candidum]
MASNGRIAAVVVLMVAILSTSVMAADICGVSTDDLIKCLPAVRQPPQAPTSACCAVIATIKLENYPCFCTYKDNPILKIFGVDVDLIFKVPAKCGIKGAPSHC